MGCKSNGDHVDMWQLITPRTKQNGRKLFNNHNLHSNTFENILTTLTRLAKLVWETLSISHKSSVSLYFSAVLHYFWFTIRYSHGLICNQSVKSTWNTCTQAVVMSSYRIKKGFQLPNADLLLALKLASTLPCWLRCHTVPSKTLWNQSNLILT